MKFKRRAQRIAGKTDLIPLLDVIFLLLIFFVLSSRFIFQSVVSVNLPEAITSEIENQDHHTVILTKSGLIFFDGRKINNLEGLNFGLELALSKDRNPLVIIKADEAVSQSRVMKIMGLAKKIGIKKIALATEPKRE
ncbi:MAG: biopolymer transporter ExbD [Nitrospirae bacterium]|nr:biopolymer transporter ExbD [Nitrospirota bacterium]